jgi:hypothetical protein
VQNKDLNRAFRDKISTRFQESSATQSKPELPADLARLAEVWTKIPAAVRQTWLAAAEALAAGNKGNAHA